MATSASRSLLPASAPLKEVQGKVQRPSELLFQMLLLGVAVALGVSLQTAGPAWCRLIFDRVKVGSAWDFAALLFALSLSIVVHELGHLSAALFLNYDILGFAIGPFRCERQHRRATVRFVGLNWFNCSISGVARDIHNCWRVRAMSVVAAGPAFTLLFVVAAVRLALLYIGLTPSASGPAQFWSCCAEVNLFLFLLGLIPNRRSAAVRNDAALFTALWRNSADALDMFRCHQAIDLALRGNRPRDYPESLMRELAGVSARPYTTLMVARRMVEWAADSGDIETAGCWDQRARSAAQKCGAHETNCALAQSACFDVLYRSDFRSARQRFGQVNFDSLFPPSLAERARAAQLIACNLPQRAPAHILRAQYHLPLGIPYYDYERMLLGKMHDQALSRCQSRWLTPAPAAF